MYNVTTVTNVEMSGLNLFCNQQNLILNIFFSFKHLKLEGIPVNFSSKYGRETKQYITKQMISSSSILNDTSISFS